MSDDNSVNGDGPRKAKSPLEEGIALVDQDKRAEAREIFRSIIRSTPDEEEAWLWLAWLAEEKRESLRILQEARVILPHNERIEKGLRWVERKLAEEEGDILEEADTESREQIEPERVFSGVDDAAERIESVFEQIRTWTYGLRLPDLNLAPLRRFGPPLLSLLIVVGLVMLVWLGISRARQEDRMVQALELPTPVLDPTATPSVEQRTRSLWIQADVAWTRENWDEVIETLQRIRAVDPQNETARSQLAEAHYNRALQLIESNDLESARIDLDQAIRLDAGNDDLQKTRRYLSRYVAGLEAYWERDWDQAIERLSSVYEMDPDFRDVEVMLAKSHYESGLESQEAEVWDEALEAYERAMDLVPDVEDAEVRRQEVMNILIPPDRIEVDLSEKQVTVYEDDKELRSFIVCTGRATAPTLPGRYEVQNKLPTAYASKWDIYMPLWLGIYYAGGSQNGFHALPETRSGTTLWRNALGTACSYGCIVLNTPDAEFLYDWAEVGTVVLIEP
ncbi:MAG: L,D-transpeptidase family protein [Anaerolineales bacterium]